MWIGVGLLVGSYLAAMVAVGMGQAAFNHRMRRQAARYVKTAHVTTAAEVRAFWVVALGALAVLVALVLLGEHIH
jgi:membrane protein YqaA with SNARE-associated domain